MSMFVRVAAAASWLRSFVSWAIVSAVFFFCSLSSAALRLLRRAATLSKSAFVFSLELGCLGCARETGVTVLTVSRALVSESRRSPGRSDRCIEGLGGAVCWLHCRRRTGFGESLVLSRTYKGSGGKAGTCCPSRDVGRDVVGIVRFEVLGTDSRVCAVSATHRWPGPWRSCHFALSRVAFVEEESMVAV